jgi:hypothetical protein
MPQSRMTSPIALIPALALSGLGLVAIAQEYEITRFTIDGGGVMHSTEPGGLELSGTIGQPDAGTMTGGGLELSGGFWFPLAPTDCNDDGVVGLPDYQDFESCLSGPGGLSAVDECRCFDVDGDGIVTMLDFSTLQIQFVGL